MSKVNMSDELQDARRPDHRENHCIKESSVDYKELLKKYMRHIFSKNGTDYIASIRQPGFCKVNFTDNEVEAIRRLHIEQLGKPAYNPYPGLANVD